MSNLGKWAPWYSQLPPDAAPQAYGISDSYRIGAEWLKDCLVVEDWGCGMGWFRQFLAPGIDYLGIDGTESPFTNLVIDLAYPGFMSTPPGIFMRGVIEHDYRWRQILRNAFSAFTERMCLVLFTPMIDEGPKEIAFVDEIGVPDLSFSIANIIDVARGDENWFMDPIQWAVQTIESPNTGYGVETIFLMEK